MSDIHVSLGGDQWAQKLVVDWFDDNGSARQTVVDVSLLGFNKPRILQIMVNNGGRMLIYQGEKPVSCNVSDPMLAKLVTLGVMRNERKREIEELNAAKEGVFVKLKELGNRFDQLKREREALKEENDSQRALIDALLHQAAILRERDGNIGTAGRYFCAVCHEHFDDDPHTMPDGEDCHEACCPECNGAEASE